MTERTITEFTVLAMLGHMGRRTVSGYDLKKFADNGVGYLWAPSKTQLYVVLRRLVADGLIVSREVRQARRPDKRLYRIAKRGRDVVNEWLERDEAEADPDRSLFMLKFFFGRQVGVEPMRRQLEAFRDAYARRLALYQEIDRAESGLEARDPYTQLTLRYGIARAQAAVGWSDDAARALRTRAAARR
jgi:PadR family transcriptional regulator, regulatory protein AphA